MSRTLRSPVANAVAAVAVAALGVSALAACQTLPSAGSGGPDPTNVSIMVGGLDKVIYLPAELTDRLGHFKEQGLTVDLQSQPSGANAETALVAGQVDAVVGFYDHTIDLQTKGKCITSVVQFANVPGEVEIVAKNSGIASAADLPGKKLGVTSPGSSTDFLTQYLTSKVGATPDKYTTVTAGAGATFIAALENGGIDAGMTTDPTAQQIKEKGSGDVLLDMRTVEGTRAALGGLYPASSLYMDCAYVQAHPGTVQKLANAFVKTMKFINTHTAAEIADKMPPDYYVGNKDQYVKALDAGKQMFTPDGVMPQGGPETVLAVLSQFKDSVKGKTIDLSKTFTTEFVDVANKK